jgi:alpha-beta hydrolase superfamily lysophospholipase
MVKPKNKPDIQEIFFASDEFMLKGYLHLPPAKHPPFVIGSHGLFSDKNSPKQIELAGHCNDLNMAYFRFDHRGCGESKAPFDAVTSLEARCRDLKAAAKMLKARDDLSDSMGLFGSSMGGAVSLSMAGRLQAATVISWAAPIRSADLVQKHAATEEASQAPFEKNPFDIRNQLAGLHNVLILHGDADETVPLSHGREIYDCVAEPKKLVVFAKCDHLMSKRADQQAFMQEASHWFQTFLKPDINY